VEATRDNHSRYGMPVRRERKGHENAEDLFSARRERQFNSGLLGETGHNSRYVLFRPSRTFVWILGDTALRLNDALYGFRRQAADHLIFLDGDRLQAHYGDLDRRVEAVRDHLVELTAYCNKGFDGRLDEALEGSEEAGAQVSQGTAEAETAPPAVSPAPTDADAFEAHRQRLVEGGILTESGRQEGWVALRPCPFYGRLMGEIVCTLNDALARVEGRMAADIMTGKEDGLRQYVRELQKRMMGLCGDVEDIIAFCGRKAA